MTKKAKYRQSIIFGINFVIKVLFTLAIMTGIMYICGFAASAAANMLTAAI